MVKLIESNENKSPRHRATRPVLWIHEIMAAVALTALCLRWPVLTLPTCLLVTILILVRLGFRLVSAAIIVVILSNFLPDIFAFIDSVFTAK
jgi:hypothetical protein